MRLRSISTPLATFFTDSMLPLAWSRVISYTPLVTVLGAAAVLTAADGSAPFLMEKVE